MDLENFLKNKVRTVLGEAHCVVHKIESLLLARLDIVRHRILVDINRAFALAPIEAFL